MHVQICTYVIEVRFCRAVLRSGLPLPPSHTSRESLAGPRRTFADTSHRFGDYLIDSVLFYSIVFFYDLSYSVLFCSTRFDSMRFEGCRLRLVAGGVVSSRILLLPPRRFEFVLVVFVLCRVRLVVGECA